MVRKRSQDVTVFCYPTTVASPCDTLQFTLQRLEASYLRSHFGQLAFGDLGGGVGKIGGGARTMVYVAGLLMNAILAVLTVFALL